ncbi:hypothetical protein Pyn_15251 [Prunus yedoensis var. nudiflora]|uniref:Uncharacterized protein n=1 Tax=Prunus yedoensis var. nudiflora TaxID=2094558 RepID=A0A314XUP1_PRUYE|nr:hypothetical protein Pyn_05288 [Prunus yedoensis var. nudiflora]PQP99366.1 hypothetical protein Pyn_15251 [Prunus yedoensis var. nudiflora]
MHSCLGNALVDSSGVILGRLRPVWLEMHRNMSIKLTNETSIQPPIITWLIAEITSKSKGVKMTFQCMRWDGVAMEKGGLSTAMEVKAAIGAIIVKSGDMISASLTIQGPFVLEGGKDGGSGSGLDEPDDAFWGHVIAHLVQEKCASWAA